MVRMVGGKPSSFAQGFFYEQLGWAMRYRDASIGIIATITFGIQTGVAAEICIDSVDAVQLAPSASGELAVYVYSKEVMAVAGNGNTYLYYSGDNDVAKAYQAQFLAAKAAGFKLCITYELGSPSHRWNISSVGVAGEDRWPWQ